MFTKWNMESSPKRPKTPKSPYKKVVIAEVEGGKGACPLHFGLRTYFSQIPPLSKDKEKIETVDYLEVSFTEEVTMLFYIYIKALFIYKSSILTLEISFKMTFQCHKWVNLWVLKVTDLQIPQFTTNNGPKVAEIR